MLTFQACTSQAWGRQTSLGKQNTPMQAQVQVLTKAFLSAGPGAYETGGTSNALWLCIRRLSGLQTLDLKLLSYAGDKEVPSPLLFTILALPRLYREPL